MLQALLDSQQAAFNQADLGRRVSVLLEGRGRRPGQLLGRSPRMQAVHVEAPEHLLGRIVEVIIVGAQPNSLKGRLAAQDLCPRDECSDGVTGAGAVA